MSSKSNNSDRYVTRRIRDKDGNFVVKRYKKRQTGLGINIPWKRVPSGLLGIILASYAYLVNLYRTENLDSLFGEDWTEFFNAVFNQFTGIAALFLTGIIAVGLAGFIGWSLLSKGFKIKQWPSAARQLLAIVAIVLLFSAIFSSFINEAGLTRHQDNEVDASDDYDLSDLSAPFYNELLEGLLDLIGNVPNPQELVATISPGTQGDTFDPNEDQYLWRWLVAETFGADAEDPYDFNKGYENYRNDFANADENSLNALSAEIKKFRVSQQYVTVGSSYSGEALSTWNSEYDMQINMDNFDVTATNSETASLNSVQTYQGINSQPILQAAMSESRTSGFLEYDSYWVQEQKTEILAGAEAYSDAELKVIDGTYDSQLSTERFGDLSKAGTLASIYGADSLPSYYDPANDQDQGHGDPTAFNAKYEDMAEFAEQNGLTVFDVILELNNQIQGAVVNMFNSGAEGTLDLSSESATQYEADPDIHGDRAYYFWDRVANDEFFGVKDAIAGYVNILRLLNIPARPVLGFSVGDVQSNQIDVRLEHLHVWIEALIPWVDDNGQLQFAWGAFNPIPNFSYLTSENPSLVFGRNSLGSTPDIEVGTTTEESDEFSDFTSSEAQPAATILTSQEEAIDVGARVSYDGVLSAGQNFEIKLLEEAELLSLVNGDVDPAEGLTAGTSLGRVTTVAENDYWANFSLTAKGNGDLVFAREGNSTTFDNFNISRVNVDAAEGSRNVYGLVVKFGLAFEYLLVGWTLNATIDINPVNTEVVTVDDAGTGFDFGVGSIDTMYTFFGENRTYELNVTTENSGKPVEGIAMKLLFMSSTEFSDFEANIDTLTSTQIDSYRVKDFPATDGTGYTNTTFALESTTRGIINLSQTRYYTFVVYATGTISYQELIVHITNDVNMTASITTTVPKVSGYNVIYENETVDYDVSYETYVTDNTLETNLIGGGSLSGRFAEGLVLDYYLVDNDKYSTMTFSPSDTSELTTMIANDCTTDLTAPSQCYELTTAGGSDPTAPFGIISGGITDASGTGLLRFSWGVIDEGHYQILIYNALGDMYHIDENEAIVFAPNDLQRASVDDQLIYNLPQVNNEQGDDPTPISSDGGNTENIVPLVLLFTIIAIPQTVQHTRRYEL